ncbi:MAG: DUF5103 domain-containing protein [Bacteroidaceae bacterium]|nr:DUF5103 domain-containing protein [Bacteroidaceae bacterium]
MKRCFFLLTLFVVAVLTVSGQQTCSFSEQIKTVRVVVNDDPLQPPVVRLGGRVEISFDELSHDYTRYIYKVEFCNADWTPATEVFESDYLAGFNNRPIEEYETSFNTTVLYTHYRFGFPNEDARLLLPGNYRVSVYADERDSDDEPVLEACFSLLKPDMNVSAQVSTNTDVDLNQHHQQVSYAISFGGSRVVDPQRELKTVVMQNRRWDNAVVNLPPNIQKAMGVEWNHRPQLIFPAGAEFHKFEILDIHLNGMGVDRMEWQEPHYHATLFATSPQHNYTYDQDVNGNYVVRHSDDEDNETQSEYLFVHFLLQTPRLPGGDVYVCGQWNNGFPDPSCRMTYDEKQKAYECGLLLKQGYYNYQFRQLTEDGVGQTTRTEGDFYQTENEYIILVYHRPQGARYDALVGYAKLNSYGNH